MRKSQIICLELGVLKLHSPSLPEFTKLIRNVEGINKIKASLIKIDRETENIKLIVDSTNIEYEQLRDCITHHKGIIQRIDKVIIKKIQCSSNPARAHTSNQYARAIKDPN